MLSISYYWCADLQQRAFKLTNLSANVHFIFHVSKMMLIAVSDK